MYLFEDMVDMALPEGERWPTEHHRQVAIRLLIANPDINTYRAIKNGVLSILSIPVTQIQEIKLDDLSHFGYGYTMIIR